MTGWLFLRHLMWLLTAAWLLMALLWRLLAPLARAVALRG